jgi:hypothetical protein
MVHHKTPARRAFMVDVGGIAMRDLGALRAMHGDLFNQ